MLIGSRSFAGSFGPRTRAHGDGEGVVGWGSFSIVYLGSAANDCLSALGGAAGSPAALTSNGGCKFYTR